MGKINHHKINEKNILLITLILFLSAEVYSQGVSKYQQFYQKLSYSQNYSSLASDSVLTKVGQWRWGHCYSAAVKGSYAYIGNGLLLQVLDISKPADPKVVGELFTGGSIRKLIISGNYAYTIFPFQIIDISDPTNPVLVKTLQLPSGAPPTAIRVEGNYAYVGDFYGIIYTIDISNPYNPNILDGRMYASGEIVESIAVKDTVLYAVAYDSPGIDVFSISDPNAPYRIKLTGRFGSSIAINKNYLYLGTAGVFSIFDISSLSSPRYVTEIPAGSFIRSITVADTIAYLIQDTIGVTQVDISDTSNIHITSQIKNPYSHPYDDPFGGDVGGTVNFPYAYIGSGTGLWIVNIEKPDSISPVFFYPTGWYVNKLAVDTSEHAFLAELYGGLKILDYKDPSSPKLTGYYYDDERVIDVAVAGSLVYLLCDRDLQIVDVTNPSSPNLLGKVSFNDTITTTILGNFDFLCLNGTTAYAARKSQKIYAINVGDPNNPEIKSTFTLKDIPVGLSVSKDYLYVADYDTGIQIFNISDPDSLNEKGFLTITPIRGLIIKKNNLFVEGWVGTEPGAALIKYDIENPLSPILKYMLNVPGGITSFVDIKIENDFAYLTYNTSFIVADISQSDSGTIVYLANSNTNPYTPGAGTFHSVAVHNGKVITGYLGVTVFKNNLITGIKTKPLSAVNFKLFQNYPNPFNSGTIISYQLSSTSQATLKIYDILGREVGTLVNTVQQAGDYIVPFDASALASGVYFYKLEFFTKDGKHSVLVKKMELLK